MVFSEYLQSLSNERMDMVKKIAEKTCTSTSVVYRWMNGTVTPGPLKQKVIADIIGIPTDELFPKTIKSNKHGN